jgi:hypothetical protein
LKPRKKIAGLVILKISFFLCTSLYAPARAYGLFSPHRHIEERRITSLSALFLLSSMCLCGEKSRKFQRFANQQEKKLRSLKKCQLPHDTCKLPFNFFKLHILLSI